MDLLEPDDEPLTLHEDIIKYLRDQNLLDGAEEQFIQDVSSFKEEQVREILEELLQKFERNQKLKEDYEERVKAHNQYPLFDLTEVLPDFHMDEAMYDALTFRETLIIQRLVGDNELVPEAVGGLCLDVQKAPGKPPERRFCCDIDTRLARVMRTKDDPNVIPISDLETHEDVSTCGSGDDFGPLEDDLATQSGRSRSKFLVHLSSQFDFDGCNAGSSITTWVDWNFHTLEEARKEFYMKKVTKLVEKVEKVIKNTSYASEDKLSKPGMQDDGLPNTSSISAKGRKSSQAQKSSHTSTLKTSKASVAGSSKSSKMSATKSSQMRRITGASKSSIANDQMRAKSSEIQAKSSATNNMVQSKSSVGNEMVQAKSSVGNDMVQAKSSAANQMVQAKSSVGNDVLQAKSSAANQMVQSKSSVGNDVVQAKSSAANQMVQAKSSVGNDMVQTKSSAANQMVQAKSSVGNDVVQAISSAANQMVQAKSSVGNDVVQAKSSAANQMVQAKSSVRSQGQTSGQTSARRLTGKSSQQNRRLSIASDNETDAAKQHSTKSIGRKVSPKFSPGSKQMPSDSGGSPRQQQSKESSKQSRAVVDVINQEESEENEVETEVVEEMVMASKNLYVGLLKGYYYVKHVSSEEDVDDRKFYSLQKTKFYISEGANFILQRYLAKTIYIGTFELSTMYINGDMCRNIYNCTGPESQFINNKRIDICRIYRTIIEECGIEHHCMTVLTLQGQIVTQTWEESNYLLQINPLLDIDNYKPAANEKILLKHAWESDMQLMSKYLDEKVANEIKIKSYMIDHPEFRNMVNDYIHTILLLKPEDIIDFTISHFISFAPQFMPANEYFDR